MTAPEDREALAEVIWTASRADESTISATGANVVADAILASDWLARVKREAAVEALREAADAYTNSVSGTKARPHARTWLRDRADQLEGATDADHA